MENLHCFVLASKEVLNAMIKKELFSSDFKNIRRQCVKDQVLLWRRTGETHKQVYDNTPERKYLVISAQSGSTK